MQPFSQSLAQPFIRILLDFKADSRIERRINEQIKRIKNGLNSTCTITARGLEAKSVLNSSWLGSARVTSKQASYTCMFSKTFTSGKYLRSSSSSSPSSSPVKWVAGAGGDMHKENTWAIKQIANYKFQPWSIIRSNNFIPKTWIKGMIDIISQQGVLLFGIEIGSDWSWLEHVSKFTACFRVWYFE